MIQFELASANQVGTLEKIDETIRRMYVNVRAKVAGLPDEEKYNLPVHTIFFDFEISLDTTTKEIQDLLDSEAEQYVVDNYPDIL
jgi:hypothetical protein